MEPHHRLLTTETLASYDFGSRFLEGEEVYRLLHSFRRHGLHLAGSPCGGIRTDCPLKPKSGEWFLFAAGSRLRNDGHVYSTRLHKGYPITREQHVILRAHGSSVVRGYYSVLEADPNFKRHIYWVLDAEAESGERRLRRGGIGSRVDMNRLTRLLTEPPPPNDGTLDPLVSGVALVHYLHVSGAGEGGEGGGRDGCGGVGGAHEAGRSR